MPGAALRSILESAAAERRNRERASGAGAVIGTSTTISSGIAGIAGMSIEDIDREMGVGTAGVSWSGDGRRLQVHPSFPLSPYWPFLPDASLLCPVFVDTNAIISFAGSEEGIYEFKINVKDRMMFPATLNFR